MADYVIPPKIPSTLHRLSAHYKNKRKTQLHGIINSIINNPDCFRIQSNPGHPIYEGAEFIYHHIYIYLEENILHSIDIYDQENLEHTIQADMAQLTTSVGLFEEINSVTFKPLLESAIPYSKEPPIIPEDTAGLWKPDMLRLFISHRDKHKETAHFIAESLEPYGVSSFVAHDDIQPSRVWQGEILNALNTMEAMLALITDDFHDSSWTNQEVGFALGTNIPILSVRPGEHRPSEGFISASSRP